MKCVPLKDDALNHFVLKYNEHRFEIYIFLHFSITICMVD